MPQPPQGDDREYRVDLHNHTSFSPDGDLCPRILLELARSRGIDCIGVTDHDDLAGARDCLALAADDPTLPRVVPGIEVHTREGEIIGLFVERAIRPGRPLADTAAEIRSQGGVVYLPHPFDTSRRGTVHRESLSAAAALADIIEVRNGRSTRPSSERRAGALAREVRAAAAAGSDAHFSGEVGRSWVGVPRMPTREDLVEVLRLGRFAAEPAPWRYVPPWYYLLRSAAAKAVGRRRGRA